MESDTAVIVPPPELKRKIDDLAAKLIELEVSSGRSKAQAMREKITSRKDFAQFAPVDAPYYLYFETRLREYRSDPAMAPSKEARAHHQESEKQRQEEAAQHVPLTDEQETHLRQKRLRDEQLEAAQADGRRDVTDPNPRLYSLQWPPGVSIPRPVHEVMMYTAQWVAKCGEKFCAAVAASHKAQQQFSFIREDDPAHPVFRGLVESYRRILDQSPDDTQSRLEVFERPGEALDQRMEEKKRFLTAEIARKRAAVLTDTDLRKTLCWSSFTVVRTFSSADFGLSAAPKAPVVAPQEVPIRAQPVAAPPAAVGGALPDGAVGWGDEDAEEVSGTQRRSSNSEYVVDPRTGQRVPIASLQAKAQRVDTSSMGAATHASTREGEGDGVLANDSVYEMRLRRSLV